MKYLKFTIKLLTITLFVFFCSLNLFAQVESCNLKVEVIDAKTNKKVKDFNFQAVNTDKRVLYKPSGFDNYIIENVFSGNINITIEKENYIDEYHQLIFDCKKDESEDTKVISIKIHQKSSEDNKTGVFMIASKDNSSSDKSINNGAVNLGKPSYPKAARVVKASGSVEVQVVIDVEGNVIYAKAISGHPLLRSVSETAAVESKFKPTRLSGEPVMVSGIIVYNFVP